MFKVHPRDKKGTKATMMLPEKVGTSNERTDEPSQPPTPPFRVSRERVVSPYAPDNLDVNDGVMMPRGALNRQMTPDTGVGRAIAQSANQPQPAQDEQPQDDYSQYANVRDRYIGQKSLDDKILDDEAYLDAMRLSKPKDENGRLKSFFKSLGMGLQAFGRQPVRDWEDFASAGGEALGYGIYGAFDPSLDERFKQQNEIARTEKELEGMYGRQGREDARENLLNKKLSERAKLYGDEKDRLIRIYNDLTDFDPESNPEHANLAAQMAALKLPAPKKQAGDRFQLQIAPDGTPVVVNTRTGKVEVQQGNYLKPAQLKETDFPDELFGLPSKDEISNLARSQVSLLPAGRRLIPEIAKALPNEVDTTIGRIQLKNPDGSVNEQALMQAVGDGSLAYTLSQLYENLPSDTEQKVAAAKAKEDAKYKPIREEVARFRNYIAGNKPKQGAAPTNRADVVSLFNEIMAITDAKQRTAALKQFYANLSNLQIQ